jgi:transcriptional regulator with XRE-family HTH domain
VGGDTLGGVEDRGGVVDGGPTLGAQRRFEAGALVARARRLSRMSQRELADAAGVARSTVGGVESGARGVSVDVLSRLLEPTGLRLAVLDRDGREVAPFPADVVRDNAERRFPAHLDVVPPDCLPTERLRSPRYDRKPARAWYHLRTTSSPAPPPDTPRADDHPTATQLEIRQQERRYGRMTWWPQRKEALALELAQHLRAGD